MRRFGAVIGAVLLAFLAGVGTYALLQRDRERAAPPLLWRSEEWRPVAYTSAVDNALPVTGDMETLIAVNRALATVVEHVRDAVVVVATSKTVTVRRPELFDPFEWFFGRPRQDQPEPPEIRRRAEGVGSGVIVSPDGYILTNNHVIEDADEIVVQTADRRDFEAKLVGADPNTDLAVLKIEADGLPTIPFGDSDQLGLGELVIAIGAPFNYQHSASFGIVSAKGRSGILQRLNPDRITYEDFIQTDAAINPGNSGGPLVNIRGELVGINTAIQLRRRGQYAGIGFAIASNLARKVMNDLITKGKVVPRLAGRLPPGGGRRRGRSDGAGSSLRGAGRPRRAGQPRREGRSQTPGRDRRGRRADGWRTSTPSGTTSPRATRGPGSGWSSCGTASGRS
ncbi:MAG: hypothetical protein KatS3mg115_2317 [Candidatus Poribacteria bacterium]|nr:MAG: hypothetical protein KatS3mg115_2317 [Candidatus Poribacteria bacterium]